MSHPIPTMDYTITKKDLDGYLAGLEQSKAHYRANKIIHKNNKGEVDYANKMLKKLDDMAVEAIARYHNQ